MTKGLLELMEPHYKTASIFVRNKAWATVDTSEFKVFFLIEKKTIGSSPEVGCVEDGEIQMTITEIESNRMLGASP